RGAQPRPRDLHRHRGVLWRLADVPGRDDRPRLAGQRARRRADGRAAAGGGVGVVLSGAARRLTVGHIVLLGDSIFDNERYVPDRPPVIEQVRGSLPAGWKATLLAVDGAIAEDVPKALRHLSADASHLFVSAGG